MTSFLVFNCKAYSSFKESFNFMFQKKESSIQLLSSVSSNHNILASWEKFIFKFKEGPFEVWEDWDIWTSFDDNVLSSFNFRPSESGLGVSNQIIDLTLNVSLIWWGLDRRCYLVWATALICWHMIWKLFINFSWFIDYLKYPVYKIMTKKDSKEPINTHFEKKQVSHQNLLI